MGNKILSGLFFLLFFSQCTNQADENSSQERDGLIFTHGMCLPDVADKYVYPIIPGTEEWKKLGSEEEAIKAYQLPDNELKNISTLGLIRSFLDIPMLSSSYHLFSDASSIGRMNKIYPYYNSAQEIINREDAGEALLLYYDAICFDCLTPKKVMHQMDFDEQVRVAGLQMKFDVLLTAVEVFFSQQQILDRLNDKDKQNIVATLLDKTLQIQEVNSYIDGYLRSAYTAVEVMANVMYFSNYQPIVEYFGSGKEYIASWAADVDDIILFANQFIR